MFYSYQELDKLKSLYKNAFPEDSQNFVDHFFLSIFNKDIELVQKKGEIISAGCIVKKDGVILGKASPVMYLSALCTHSSHRNKGHFTTVLIRLLNTLYKRNVPFCFLYPFNHTFYKRYDFCDVSFCCVDKIKGGEACVETCYTCNPPKNILQVLARVEEAFYEGCDSHLTHTKHNFEHTLKEFAADGIPFSVYATSDNVDDIFAYGFTHKQKIIHYRTNDMQKFKRIESLKGYTFYDFTGATKPYIQARIVDVKAALQASTFLIKSPFTICVVDDWLKQNTATYRVENAKVEKIAGLPNSAPNFSMSVAQLTQLLLVGDDILIKKQNNLFTDQY